MYITEIINNIIMHHGYFFFAEGMCKNLLKDTRKNLTLPGVWDFHPLKITPPSSANMYLSPRNRREALLQGDTSQDPATGLFLSSITFYAL